jgi:hypothetical protein
MRRAGNFHTAFSKRGFLAFGHSLMVCKDPNGLSIAQPNVPNCLGKTANAIDISSDAIDIGSRGDEEYREACS